MERVWTCICWVYWEFNHQSKMANVAMMNSSLLIWAFDHTCCPLWWVYLIFTMHASGLISHCWLNRPLWMGNSLAALSDDLSGWIQAFPAPALLCCWTLLELAAVSSSQAEAEQRPPGTRCFSFTCELNVCCANWHPLFSPTALNRSW